MDKDVIMCQMGDLFMCVQAFNNLRTQKLGVSASIHVNRIGRAMQEEMKILNEAKSDILDRYGEKDDKGNLAEDENGGVKITDVENFRKEWEELMSTGVMLPVAKLKLYEIKHVDMTPQDVELIMFLIEDGEDDK